jgi:hypothetical protein
MGIGIWAIHALQTLLVALVVCGTPWPPNRKPGLEMFFAHSLPEPKQPFG